MSARDPNFPDDFPDMQLPERGDGTPEPPRANTPVSRLSWRAGDRVLAPWEPSFLYAGQIVELQDDQALIQFGDGDAGWVYLRQLRPQVVTRGQRVLSRRRMGPQHFPAEILEVDGDRVRVSFSSGQEPEWTTLAALRIPCEVTGPGAAPTKMVSQRRFFDNLQPGERVWAPWGGQALFAGKVARLKGPEVLIQFDDGDEGWVPREQLLPLEIPVGALLAVRRQRGGPYAAAYVTAVQGERIQVRFENDESIWTDTAALMVPLAPAAPDIPDIRLPNAQRGGGSNAALGWLIPIAIVVAFFLLRNGCR